MRAPWHVLVIIPNKRHLAVYCRYVIQECRYRPRVAFVHQRVREDRWVASTCVCETLHALGVTKRQVVPTVYRTKPAYSRLWLNCKPNFVFGGGGSRWWLYRNLFVLTPITERVKDEENEIKRKTGICIKEAKLCSTSPCKYNAENCTVDATYLQLGALSRSGLIGVFYLLRCLDACTSSTSLVHPPTLQTQAKCCNNRTMTLPPLGWHRR